MMFDEFMTYYEQQMKFLSDKAKIEERFTGRICSVMANCYRDSKKKKNPYTEEDFMASIEKKKMSMNDIATALKVITVASGGEVNG